MLYKFNNKFILNLNQASESKPKQLGCIVRDAMFSFLWIDTAQNKYLTTKNLIIIFVHLYIVNVAFPTSIHHLSRRRTQGRHFTADGEAKWLNDFFPTTPRAPTKVLVSCPTSCNPFWSLTVLILRLTCANLITVLHEWTQMTKKLAIPWLKDFNTIIPLHFFQDVD